MYNTLENRKWLLKLEILFERLQTNLTQLLGPDHQPKTEFKLVFARTFAIKTYACHAHNGIVPLGPFELQPLLSKYN